MGTTEKEGKPNEYRGAMLVCCVRGKELTSLRLTESRYVLGAGESDGTVPAVPADTALREGVKAFFRETENGYAFVIEEGAERFWINGQQKKQIPGEPVSVELDHADVIRLDQPDGENSHPEAAVFVYHSHFAENIQWKTVSLDAGKKKLYISRHDQMEGDGEEVLEELAELPGHYAVLEKDGDRWYVEDHNTKYGVYINRVQIPGRQALRALDVISVGASLFLYQQDSLTYNHVDTAKNCLVIHIEERSVWNLFKKQVLLEDIDLTILPGEMVLILGGSGAGKTTFINAVMGYEKAKGKIMEGDIDIYENYNQMKYEIGFVPQQDLLRLEDTVYGTLQNAAQMKMPRTTGREAMEGRISEILELFGLERERDSQVSKLSGGQRKRLSIAVEFIADPALFFLDEPDSGLDGVMARSLMEDLRGIADQRKMVLVITHSPDRGADLFDKVVVLAKGNQDNVGRMVFYGTVDEARDYFETQTLEEIVLRINRADEGGEGLADTYIEKYNQIKEKHNG